MKVALIHNAVFPVRGYGGTERVVAWVAKGLSERGVRAVLACKPGSVCDFAEVFPLNTTSPLDRQLPDVDLFHFFTTPPSLPSKPYVVTIGGNGRRGEIFPLNTVFVSRNHAERHGSDRFVYNGIDPDEYVYSEKKQDYLLFLGKASWKVKNVQGAIRYAREAHMPIHILGGKRLFFKGGREVHWEGEVDGKIKASFLAQARALLWPVIWNEPFGLAVVEALMSGTPVIASCRGAAPEIVKPGVGFLCDKHQDFLEAIRNVGMLQPKVCRDWAIHQFHYLRMTDAYLSIYNEVISGKTLNAKAPVALGQGDQLLPIKD